MKIADNPSIAAEISNIPHTRQSYTVDARSIESELRASIHGEVRFDAGSRALYATDSSNYRQVPIGVVIPKDVDDVYKTIITCQHYGVPLLARGGGTSLAGQCCNVAVIIDMSKYMHKIIEIDPRKKLARVQPGTILDDLRNAAEQYQLTFGPDPATHNHCTLGGMIGNDSCGTHSVMAGKTVDNIEELNIITGCCGMAGAFGFEKDHYDVSLKVGKRVLLPAVRNASKNTLIVADGFSYREQIAQSTDRRALHLAQVLQMALPQHQHQAIENYPEKLPVHSDPGTSILSLSRSLPFIFSAGVMLVGGVSAWLWMKSKK